VKNRHSVFVLVSLLLTLPGCGGSRIWDECGKKTSIDAFALRIRTNEVPFLSYYSIEISRRGEWDYIELFRESVGPPESKTPTCDSIGEPWINSGLILGLNDNEAISFDGFKTWKIRPRTRR
jgi:hypothetical protein